MLAGYIVMGRLKTVSQREESEFTPLAYADIGEEPDDGLLLAGRGATLFSTSEAAEKAIQDTLVKATAAGHKWPSKIEYVIVEVRDQLGLITQERQMEDTQNDPVNRPMHYTSHPSGVECIQVTEHMGFNLGNAVKYIWRADLKSDAIEDLKKAKWYIERELLKRGA